MSISKMYKVGATYFVSDLNNAGEVSSWQRQKRSKKNKLNPTYIKNWRKFLKENRATDSKPQEKPPQMFRVKKDGTRIPITPEPLDPDQLSFLKSI